MNEFSIDTLRRIGMTALFATLCVIAAGTVATEAAIGSDAVPTLIGFAILAAYPAWLWRSGATDATARMAMSMALVAAPALSLYAFAGEVWQTDLHMIFFATLAMGAMLCDWRAILASTAVVAVHHLLLGMIVPDWVFYGGGSILRILLHAVILIAETAALLFLVERVVALIETVQAQAERQQAIDAAVADERAARMAELEGVTREMGEALDRLSCYDLAHAIDRDFPEAYAALRGNFNAAVANLRDLVSAVRDGTLAAEDASGQIAAASDDLAARIEATAANVEEAFAALTAVRQRIEQGDAVVQSTLAEADGATGTVRAGRTVTDDAVRRMQAIAASADGIDDVIEGLDKIAFQTRVLAMNAAVEAGRAGEAGRGFAVVADLVGALAMRSEDEARRAREQLSAIKTDMGGAVSIIVQVDTALETIASTVVALHDRLSSLAADHGSQTQAIAQVSEAMSAVEQFVQQNAAMVEQTSAAARGLSGDIRALARQAAMFRMDAAPAGPKSFVPAASAARNGG